jgi:hypothetical protein
MNGYGRFGAMIGTSTVVMFGLMYLNTYQLDHVFFSETRAYMALVMGATMAVVMLAYMLGMYRNQRANLAIFGGSVAVFAIALWLVRSQATVTDVAWMKAMIPHHSIAILTSERANLSDPRARKLADQIHLSQQDGVHVGVCQGLLSTQPKSLSRTQGPSPPRFQQPKGDRPLGR